jgi:hypothetical protein
MASRAIPARRTHFACVVEVKDTSMATGTVKWLSPQIDYAGLTNLIKGQKVSYDVVTTDRGRTAAGKRKTG